MAVDNRKMLQPVPREVGESLPPKSHRQVKGNGQSHALTVVAVRRPYVKPAFVFEKVFSTLLPHRPTKAR